jgi:hypothetical protein
MLFRVMLYRYIEINRALRRMYPELVASTICGIEAIGGAVRQRERPTAELAIGTAHECSITTQCLRSPAGRIESWRHVAR